MATNEEILLSEFKSSLNKFVVKVIKELFDLGFRFNLTGGTVRDFIIHSTLGNDFDFELTYKVELTDLEWQSKRLELVKFLENNNIKCKTAPKFGVIQFDINDLAIELAPARRESFDHHEKETSSNGHSDLHIEFLSYAKTSDSFIRRDFTINAIGIKFDFKNDELKLSIEDPFGGIKDISQKVLVHCGSNFKCDPVRLLRAIRFHLKFGFHISTELEKEMNQVNLSLLTSHYFFYEAFKVSFFEFTSYFFDYVESNNIALSKQIKNLSFLSTIKCNDTFSDHKEIVVKLIQENINKENLEFYRSTAGVRKSFVAQAAKIAH